MDTKAYIESGIIESYVLGLTSGGEAAELVLLCAQYPEIKAAVAEFERLIEEKAFAHAIEPPARVRQNIMDSLSGEFANTQPAPPVVPLHTAETNVTGTTVRNISAWRFFAAASVILLVASLGLNFYLYNSYKATNSRYEALVTERNSLQANNEVFRTRLSGLEESMRIMQNPDMKVIQLNGTRGKENNLAAVYWDAKTKDVYLLPTKMDAIPGDKQYQLWAIVDGKPVDAGLISDCDGLCKMKNIPNAQAFAITLEKKGGSTAPTLSAMYVVGKV